MQVCIVYSLMVWLAILDRHSSSIYNIVSHPISLFLELVFIAYWHVLIYQNDFEMSKFV